MLAWESSNTSGLVSTDLPSSRYQNRIAFRELPEIRKKPFHVTHVVINQHPTFGLVMRLRK
jgi:hypothetical protein